MKKTLIGLTLLSTAVLLALPFLSVTLAEAQSGMGFMLLLMFIANPITALVTGAVCGRKIKYFWWFPLAFSVLFLICYWLVLEEIILDLTIYACIYLLLGVLSLLISHFAVSKTVKNK